MKKYNKLSDSQIAVLKSQGCTCADWSLVEACEGFDTEYVSNVTFSGNVRMGVFENVFTLRCGLSRHSGIYNAVLHNVVVGDNCLIENIHVCIANYVIGSGTVVRNVVEMSVDSLTSFGNGVRVDVLNETGGREVYIHDHLTSHEAYMMAQYKDNKPLVNGLKALVDKYVAEVSSEMGIVGCNVRVQDCQIVRNVRIGDWAKICGVSRLHNGTVLSCKEAPTEIGLNVIADDFIVCSGSLITDSVMLTRCFVGQACVMSHSYSASDSLFFSNCHEENGEACAVFAGPYTVTHHKSTLLIAGMFSFMNAGSGSNQSNHMYKLGPIHYGLMERGAKTTSDSYILWPARVGAFSLVMGRHVNNMDTTDFPFSYLIEQQGSTYIVPGVNLKSVGTVRDVKKWPRRDKRTDPAKMDSVNFNLLSPFTMQRVFKGMGIMRSLKDSSGGSADNYYYRKAIIRNAALNKGLHYYEIAMTKFLGNSIISRMQKAEALDTDAQLRAVLAPGSDVGLGEWLDLSGLIAPKSLIDKLSGDIASGEVSDIRQLERAFKSMHEHYYEYEWTWAYNAIESFFGIDMASITRAQAAEIVRKWKSAVVSLDKLIYEDAKKEFTLGSMTGFEENPFVLEVMDHIARKSALGDQMIASLQ